MHRSSVLGKAYTYWLIAGDARLVENQTECEVTHETKTGGGGGGGGAGGG